MSLRRYTWRAMQQRPGRTILTVLSIVIGVTAAVAINLGTATTRNAYKQMFALVTGRATLEVDGKGGVSFPQDLLKTVAAVDGVEVAVPLVQKPRKITVGEDRGVRLEILGIDPDRDKLVRDYNIVAGRQVNRGEELVLEKGFAAYFGLKVGEELPVLTNSGPRPFQIVGLFEPQTGAAFTQMAMAFTPLDTAQRHFHSRYVPRGSIDKIQIVTDPEADVDQVRSAIAAILPEEVQVHRPAASTQLMQETLQSLEQGLTLTTYFSLLMAAFIILNTFLMNVSERRRHLSILRAIGARKRQITQMLLGESLLLGVIGTAVGMALGVVTAWIVTYILAISFQVQLPRLVEVMTPRPFVLGAVFGLCMALVGALIPALLAGRVSPLEGMNRTAEARSRNFTWLFLSLGLVLTVGSLTVIFGSIFGWLRIDAAAEIGPLLLIGLVMLDSVILAPQAKFIAWLLAPLARVEAGLALKQVLRHHTRSALTVGVLFIAGSTGIGMASSILDNVQDVHDWFEQAIVGDYFIRAMMPDMATGTAADLPDGLGDDLENLRQEYPHFKLDAAAFVEAQVVPPGGDPSEVITAIVICRKFVEGQPSFDLISGDRTKIGDQLRDGQVVIGSVLAQKLGLTTGDKLPLETREGIQQAAICGVANDYMVGGLSIHMHRDQAARWLGVEGVDGYMIKADEGYREALRPGLLRIARKYDVFLLSQGDIRRNVDRIVAGVQWSLWALVYMGFVVAAFGVVNTLTMNVLEQTRELGLLRIVAMTRRQVRRTIVIQALIIGGVGLPPGILLGVAIAYILNLAMMPSFGHSIEFQFHPRLLAATFVGAAVIVRLATWFPARRAARINVVEALHYE